VHHPWKQEGYSVRVAILAEKRDSYRKIQAQGLKRMFAKLEIESHIFYDGLDMLNLQSQLHRLNSNPVIRAGRLIRDLIGRKLRSFYSLRDYDVIVVVASMPYINRPELLVNIERVVRACYPEKIIVAYPNYYLLTREYLLDWIKRGTHPEVLYPGNYGLERFDWYLCSSVVSDYPLPRADHPYTTIGVNLDDGTLYPEKPGQFVALVDFLFSRNIREWTVQIQALEETKTSYIILNRPYTVAQIRRIYRGCSMFFVAHRESFGMGICENQACGNYIFTPYAHWCHAHWIKEDLYAAGPGRLSPNFVVYNNDLEYLKSEIERVKAEYNAQHVRQTFLDYHPHFYHGDTNALERFCAKIACGEITSQSHLAYEALHDIWYQMHPERDAPGVFDTSQGWNLDRLVLTGNPNHPFGR
jgi:hypothetical protein